MIPGWPYSVVAALEPGRTSWMAPLDTARLGPDDDETEVTAAQVREVAGRLIAAGHWRSGDPDILVVSDAGYDIACPLAADLRLPWEKPTPPGRLTPARVRRGFRSIRATLPCPAGAPKPGKPGPGRPPGSKNRRSAPICSVGKTSAKEPFAPRPGQQRGEAAVEGRMFSGRDTCKAPSLGWCAGTCSPDRLVHVAEAARLEMLGTVLVDERNPSAVPNHEAPGSAPSTAR